jgi:WD40 repeat protein
MRYLPTHLTAGRLWNELCDVLTDFDYLQAKIGAVNYVLSQHPPAAMHSPTVVFDLLRDFQNALAALPVTNARRREVVDLYHVVNENLRALEEDSSLLVQQVYNELVWGWDATTELGQRIRHAAEHYERFYWLKRLNAPTVPGNSAVFPQHNGHSDAVHSVAFSTCGGQERLASASGDTTVRFWDAQTGELEQKLTEHHDAVYEIAFSQDGKTMVSGSGDNKVRLWDAQMGKLLCILEGHSDGVWTVAITRDGTQVASGSVDGTVNIACVAAVYRYRTGHLV